MPHSDPSPTQHVPVLADEVLEWLQAGDGRTIVDGTLGGGGHTERLLDAVGPSGRVIALDRDATAIARAEPRFAGRPLVLCQSNFSDIPEVLDAAGVGTVDGVLLDVGLSSDQLADQERGFSFLSEGPLDLRFNTDEGEPAWRLINRLSEGHLADLIFAFGEERYSRRIARNLVAQRRLGELRKASEIAKIVRRSIPPSKSVHKIDGATRTFQALRIAVNEELKSLEIALRRIPERLRPGGRLVVISFHSLEDRRVKTAFRDDERYEVLTRKAIGPTEAEVATNPRSRSAKLRAAQRIASSK